MTDEAAEADRSPPSDTILSRWLPMAIAAIIVALLMLSGPLGGLAVTDPDHGQLDDGTATVTVLQPDTEGLSVTPGRFGTEAVYLRVPDLVVDVEQVAGQPRLVYDLSVPALDVDEHETRVVHTTGTTRVRMSDVAMEPVEAGTYEGTIEIRVQSFAVDETVVNQTVEVTVP